MILNNDELYRNNLDLESFSSMLDRNSECYKFYWFEALIDYLVLEDKQEITYYEATAAMIVQAWYTVAEYHLHMGSVYGNQTRNAIERAVVLLQSETGLSSTCSKKELFSAIETHKEKLSKILNQMTDDVPYRTLSPFVPELKGNNNIWHSDNKVIAYFDMVNKKVPLPYTIRRGDHLMKTVVWHPSWAEMVKDNYIILKEWIRSKKIKYLQARNPGVPGIIYKLDSESVRKLKNVHNLWDAVMQNEPVHDIYSNNLLNGKRYDIDHFIPWSYVAADELWNLTPAEKTSNSSKSNSLPEWSLYFDRFTDNQIQLNRIVHQSEQARSLFEKCRKDNLNTLWASEKLYNSLTDHEFRLTLEENMKPIYSAAKLQGYRIWRYSQLLNSLQ